MYKYFKIVKYMHKNHLTVQPCAKDDFLIEVHWLDNWQLQSLPN